MVAGDLPLPLKADSRSRQAKQLTKVAPWLANTDPPFALQMGISHLSPVSR